jgi:Outer membrane protein beta-barrel family/CarboxypepD_reg-like domain
VLLNFKGLAQNGSISGIIVDELNVPLIGANISLLNTLDSSLIKGVLADVNGIFKIENIVSGNVIIKVSYIGYNNYYLNKSISNQSIVLNEITLSQKTLELKEINIEESINATSIKGDTTQYNAGAFKTNVDASAEDLVTKLPGVNVQDGKVQAQGEDVKKILVDGKPYFGDDPNAVLKNMPAEMIDKIQILDGKSEQSQFTGFDDGNAMKTMNIITKTQYKDGVFGKVFLGAGNNQKYKGGFNLNLFKQDRRITLLCNTNNINEQNFSAEDLQPTQAVSSSNSNRPQGMRSTGNSGRGGSQNEVNNFLIDQKNGINTTHSFGVNYVNKWNKVELMSSYFVNFIDNESFNNKIRQNFSNTSSQLKYIEASNLESTNLNHRINTKIEFKFDSLNAVTIQPKLSYQHTRGNSFLEGENFDDNTFLSNSISNNRNNLSGVNYTLPVLYKHSFAKKGRTISINLSAGNNHVLADGELKVKNNIDIDSLGLDTIDQKSNLDRLVITKSSNISFTELLGKKSQLQFSIANNYNKSAIVKETFNISLESEKTKDIELSNNFTTRYYTNNFGFSYNFTQKSWNFSTGLAYQIAVLDNRQSFPTFFETKRKFNSILPNASMQIKFSDSKNLRINYRTSNNSPTAEQLQSVINNTNPLQLTIGNSNLKQNFQNNGFIRYSSSNTTKNTSFFVMAGATVTKNYFANSIIFTSTDSILTESIVLPIGGQLTKPINLNGYYNLRSFSNYSFSVDKIKCKVNLNAFVTYGNTPGLINSEKTIAKNTSYGMGVGVSSNISKNIDFNISTNSVFNNSINTLQKQSNNKSFNQNTKFKVTVLPWKGLVLQTELNIQNNKGLSTTLDINYTLLNAALGYKFLKNDLAELRISVFDLLKENNNVSRIVSEGYFEDIQSNVLQQYVMLTFTYNIKAFNKKENP